MRILFLLAGLFAGSALAEPGVCPDGRILINEAPKEVFTRLKGVGDKKAEAIVADRTTNGPFATTGALNRVKGVGDKSLEKWAAQITVSCADPVAAGAPPAPAGDAAPSDAAGEKAEGWAGAGAEANIININTATAAELNGLPGIGQKTADAIIAARAAKPNAKFTSLDELKEVKGIGDAKLEKLRPHLKLE